MTLKDKILWIVLTLFMLDIYAQINAIMKPVIYTPEVRAMSAVASTVISCLIIVALFKEG